VSGIILTIKLKENRNKNIPKINRRHDKSSRAIITNPVWEVEIMTSSSHSDETDKSNIYKEKMKRWIYRF